DYAAQRARGFGAPSPYIQNTMIPMNRPGVSAAQLSGQELVKGGVANPVENLTPQQRIQYGAAKPFDFLRSNPALAATGNFLTNAASRIAGYFGGGSTGAGFPPSANAQPVPTPTP